MKCPKCNKEDLQSMYVRKSLPGSKGNKRTFKAIGYVCVNPDCDFSQKSKPDNTGYEE
jgi:hypothetical protein